MKNRRLSKLVLRKKLLPAGLVILFIVSASLITIQQRKPVLYIIGDSTVKNGDGTGKDMLMGWGSVITPYFDTAKISVLNNAIGGRSSRTFINEGRWDKILAVLQPGDYVMMQFGHNDSGPLDDTARARGTLKGVGQETKDIFNPKTNQPETVHTYGWYMRKYANDTKAKGATAIVCSPIPRNIFNNGKTERADSSYGGWAGQTAAATGAYFIDLNSAIADRYDAMGPDKVKEFFPGDHTHTNDAGAKFNAGIVISELKKLKHCRLKKYLF